MTQDSLQTPCCLCVHTLTWLHMQNPGDWLYWVSSSLLFALFFEMKSLAEKKFTVSANLASEEFSGSTSQHNYYTGMTGTASVMSMLHFRECWISNTHFLECIASLLTNVPSPKAQHHFGAVFMISFSFKYFINCTFLESVCFSKSSFKILKIIYIFIFIYLFIFISISTYFFINHFISLLMIPSETWTSKQQLSYRANNPQLKVWFSYFTFLEGRPMELNSFAHLYFK